MANHEDQAGLQPLSWTPADSAKSLERVRDYVETEGTSFVLWYAKKKIWKRRMSAALRVVAILFFTLGGLIPLSKATWPGVFVNGPGAIDLSQLGYLLIAVAGAAIAFDRFFGYSSGWIRYITTEMAIQRSIDEFRLDWARQAASMRGAEPSPEQVEKFFQLCQSFAAGLRAQVAAETKAWVLEFQSNLADLEKTLKVGSDQAKAKTKAAGA